VEHSGFLAWGRSSDLSDEQERFDASERECIERPLLFWRIADTIFELPV